MGCEQSSDVYLNVVSVYAPTFRAPGDIVKCLYDELQDSDVWSSVLGHFGIDDLERTC